MTSRLMDPKDKDGLYPFKYTDSRHTDVGALYKRIRKEQLESLKPPQPLRVITERKRSNERS